MAASRTDSTIAFPNPAPRDHGSEIQILLLRPMKPAAKCCRSLRPIAGHQKPSLAAVRRPNRDATSEITPRCARRYLGAMVLWSVMSTCSPQAPGSTNSLDHHQERTPARLRLPRSPAPRGILSSGSVHRTIPFFNGTTVRFPYCGHHFDDLSPLACREVTGTLRDSQAPPLVQESRYRSID
jgi:hypothetical protein